MDFFSRDELATLIQPQKGVCLSVYLPTYHAGQDIRQDRIVLKDLLLRAGKKLLDLGFSPPAAIDYLNVGHNLLEEHEFWKHQSDGLALFISEDRFYRYRLPVCFKEQLAVSDSFEIKPLLELFTAEGRFFILALSQKQIRLMQGSLYSVGEIHSADIPKSIYEVLWYDDPERQLQWHSWTAPPFGSKRRAMFHGHGTGKDDHKTTVSRYFHQVDQDLHNILRDEKAPMIIAGVEYLFPLYREANSYQFLLADEIPGNPELILPRDLHSKALEILKPHFAAEQKKATDKYWNVKHLNRATNDLREALAASYMGRVEFLFVLKGFEQWGIYNPKTMELVLDSQEQTGDLDLLGQAAIWTICSRGYVYEVASDKMPDSGPVAAVFRY